ncbi:hypothetical protein [Acetomicrobium thermoterrenum]|nr:hypothetical protein [Acetomicrobium thermoterrenum]
MLEAAHISKNEPIPLRPVFRIVFEVVIHDVGARPASIHDTWANAEDFLTRIWYAYSINSRLKIRPQNPLSFYHASG